MTREEIYAILEGEEAYQEKQWGAHKDSENSVGDFITYMQHYMTKIVAAYTENKGPLPALDQMRKLVELGIACFKVHGVPQREKAVELGEEVQP